jgi:hypothetical protein
VITRTATATLLLLLGLVAACGSPTPPLTETLPPPPPVPASAPATIPPAAGPPAPTPPTNLCQSNGAYYGSGAYDGGWGCRPGEAVTVSRILDAATFELVDGRHVRLGGVVVREATSCGGQQALAATLTQVQEGQQVNLVLEPGAGADPYGSTWAYLQTGPPSYATDLGRSLATSGFAESYPQGANPTYVQALSPVVDLARRSHTGQYGPPCGPAVAEEPTPAATPAPASNPHVHVDVDRHHNSRDGALTGGFCRHHWWC